MKRVTSDSFKRDIVYVGSLTDLRRAISACILELIIGIENMDNSSTGFKFENFVRIGVRLLYFKNPSDVVEISEETVKQGFKYRPLPEWIRNSKSISNIKNSDDRCLVWAILRSLYPAKDRHHTDTPD